MRHVLCRSAHRQLHACCRRLAGSRQQLHTARAAAAAAAAAVAAAGDSGSSSGGSKKRLVFLGTPEVAAVVLQELLAAAQQESASFQVAAVVSQPGKPKGRGNKATPVPSPVEQLARQHLPDDAILCPRSAKDPAFLEAFAALQPDLAVTAAYGNMLPAAFLDIPTHGTLNIHPSLLPLYRGAAPVQRALQDGVTTSGVSVAFTVLACDAGPVLVQEHVAVGGDESAPQLLDRLFKRGAQLLVQNINRVWSGEAARMAQPQDHSQATHAAKLTKEEAQLDFSKPAAVLHNQVRAFAGWPGTFASLLPAASGSSSGEGAAAAGAGKQQQQQQPLQVKVLQTRHIAPSEAAALLQQGAAGGAPGASVNVQQRQVVFLEQGRRMLLLCGDGGALEVLQLQPPTKKAMEPKAFFNGLGGRQLLVVAAAAPPQGQQQQQQQQQQEGAAKPACAAA